MQKRIKLIWDFKGPTSEKIATHHCIHLKEYAVIENYIFMKLILQ